MSIYVESLANGSEWWSWSALKIWYCKDCYLKTIANFEKSGTFSVVWELKLLYYWRKSFKKFNTSCAGLGKKYLLLIPEGWGVCWLHQSPRLPQCYKHSEPLDTYKTLWTLLNTLAFQCGNISTRCCILAIVMFVKPKISGWVTNPWPFTLVISVFFSDIWGMKLNVSKTKKKWSSAGDAQCFPSHPLLTIDRTVLN